MLTRWVLVSAHSRYCLDFRRFDRNLNTGGKNYDEAKGVVAHNAVHHARQYPSEVKLTVVKR